MGRGYTAVEVDGETVYRSADGTDIMTKNELDRKTNDQACCLPDILTADPEAG